jgi:hypothetical protein
MYLSLLREDGYGSYVWDIVNSVQFWENTER